MSKKFSEIFLSEYYNKMLSPQGSNPIRNRADNFLTLFKMLENKNLKFYNIVETGCMRQGHGNLCFGDDGASSFLFNEFLKINNGRLTSIDINEKNVQYTNSFLSNGNLAYCCDSVEFLENKYEKIANNIDLLYLDSFDIEMLNPLPSQKHHLKEFNSALKFLNPGSIVVVDDHNAFFTSPPVGKGNLIKAFMEEKGFGKLIFENYQIGWVL